MGEKSRQTIPNCSQLCYAVVTENTVPTLLYDSSLLAPWSLSDNGSTVNCCSHVCVTDGVTHMAHCAAHSAFAPGLWPHHPCHPGRLPFSSVRLPYAGSTSSLASPTRTRLFSYCSQLSTMKIHYLCLHFVFPRLKRF